MKRLFTLAIAITAIALLSVSSTLAQDLRFPPGADSKFTWESYEKFKEKAKSMDLEGETVSVFGPFLGPDKEMIESVFDYFEAATGATVKHSGSDSFEQQIVIDLESGSPANIAIFPQPGLAANLANRGHLSPLSNEMGDWIKNNYAAGQSWVDLASFAGKDGKKDLYGFFYKVDLKSLVWYSPENFEDAGYEIPSTMEALFELSDQMVADGVVPWCIGLGSGAATGWPATDWIEDIMLRIHPPTDYDRWVTNDLKFNDSKVIEAVETFGKFALNDKYVVGGSNAVASLDFRDSPKGLFTSPPQCYMHRMASFIPAFFPKGTLVGEDVDFFYFPSYENKNLGQPILGGGALFTITKDSKGARALMEFLQSEIAHEIWMAQSPFLTPHKGVNPDVYADPTVRKMNTILLNADTFRFDGSDLMPGPIGAGAFWTGMIDYVGGKSAQDVTERIQKDWDSLK